MISYYRTLLSEVLLLSNPSVVCFVVCFTSFVFLYALQWHMQYEWTCCLLVVDNN